jgi:hypothetical protein
LSTPPPKPTVALPTARLPLKALLLTVSVPDWL